MTRLLEAFRKIPSPANRKRLQDYLNKHAMALCLATPEQVAFLREHRFTV